MDKNKVQLFENKRVRSVWDAEKEEWFFSVVDVVAILTDSPNPRSYWKVLKHRLIAEGSELVTNCNQLKMPSSDGKNYLTDVATTEQLFRLIQSIPSPKAEPFKLWLAKIGREKNLRESTMVANKGANVAKNARLEIERQGGKVISSENAKQLGQRNKPSIQGKRG
ncbi:hypothetical protein R83H12_01842 [Fibrobacteria bacterium R8-3-H12]